MQRLKGRYIVLLLILILAAFLRLWQLNIVPPDVHADEAAGSYQTYSIMQTGMQPHGAFNLLALEDDNTGGTHAPLYNYFLMPSIKVFGLNAFSARFPSAVFGTLSVLLVFFISKKLFNSFPLGLLSSVLFALNPWALHVSRQGLGEAISLFFILLGTAVFLYSQRKLYMLALSAIFFGLSVFSYDAPKIFLPPFILLLVFFTKDTVFKTKSYFLTFIIILLLFYGAMLKTTFLDNGLYHFSRASVFDTTAENVDRERTQTKAPLWLSSIFHNKLSVSFKEFEYSYTNIFSINWFFINGSGNLQHAVGNHGEFFLFELPFFFIGIYLSFKRSLKLGLFLLGWMLVGALPGGLTNGNYALRSIHVLPVPILFSSLGIAWFWKSLSKKGRVFINLIKLAFLLAVFAYVSSYLFTYFFDYPVYASESWAKQQNDAIRFVMENKNKYGKVFVDGGEPWAITYAYLNKTDPSYYQKEYRNQENIMDKQVIKLDNVYFGNFALDQVSTPSSFFPKNSMLVTNATNFPGLKYIKSFKDPGGIRDIFKIFVIN